MFLTFYILGLVIVWFGSIIASLWLNLYENILKKLYCQSANVQSEKLYFINRIILLLSLSILYIVLMKSVSAVLIKSIWNKIKYYFHAIEIENLRYNAPSPIPLVI